MRVRGIKIKSPLARNRFRAFKCRGVAKFVCDTINEAEASPSGGLGMSSMKCSDESNYRVFVLHEGYSRSSESGTCANCTCTLIKGEKNIVVDTMTPWDGELILKSLRDHGLEPDEIDVVVSTHGHSDHCGNNNLFLNALHIVGFTISHRDNFYDHKFNEGIHYKIDEFVEVIPTPGHMLAHVSILVRTYDKKNIVIAGDLFENENDVNDEGIWKEAGSENEELQLESRQKILMIADCIVPGHGRMFDVPVK